MIKQITGLLLAVVVIGIVPNKAFGYSHAQQANAHYQAYYDTEQPQRESLQELYKGIIMTMLWQPINTAVKDYYEKNTGYSPNVDSWEPKVLSLEKRPEGYRSYPYVIKLEVQPYLGAHNSIGVDQLTVGITYEEVKVLEYRHIQDKPIPPWLQHR